MFAMCRSFSVSTISKIKITIYLNVSFKYSVYNQCLTVTEIKKGIYGHDKYLSTSGQPCFCNAELCH